MKWVPVRRVISWEDNPMKWLFVQWGLVCVRSHIVLLHLALNVRYARELKVQIERLRSRKDTEELVLFSKVIIKVIVVISAAYWFKWQVAKNKHISLSFCHSYQTKKNCKDFFLVASSTPRSVHCRGQWGFEPVQTSVSCNPGGGRRINGGKAIG